MKGKKRKSTWKWLFFIFLPLIFLVKAVYSIWEAMRGDDVKRIEAEGKIVAPYGRRKCRIQTRDGKKLTATVFVPAGEGPFPAIIMVHAWPLWRAQCDLLYAPSFARRGYIVLTYDCRGWGSSEGEVSVAASDKEMCDLEDAISWLTGSDADLPVDAERIGVTGISNGGGHTYLAAARDPRIKAAVPMSGWTDLYYSLVPNDCWKAPWSAFLFVTGMWAHKFKPGGDLMRWFKALVIEWNPPKLKEELDTRSAIYHVDEVKCPMFIVHSWNDDLFVPNEALKFYEKLKGPKKLHMANGIHAYDAIRGDYPVPNKIWHDTRRWFDFWLKGERDNGIDKEPQVVYFRPWDGKMATARAWPPEGLEEVRMYLRGEAALNTGMLSGQKPEDGEAADLLVNNTVSSVQSSGPPFIRPNVFKNLPIPGLPFTLPGDSLAFTTGPFISETDMVGTPRVEIYASSSTAECQINALLYDVSPKGFSRLVTHCAMMKRDMEPGRPVKFEFELIACAHRFKEGHKARLVLCAADPMYVIPSQVPSQYRVMNSSGHPSSVTLPLMEAKGP